MHMYEPSEVAAFLQRLLTSPGERQAVDYKTSVAFVAGDSFSLKLIRHVQGMANADGGWLVIGYQEQAAGLLVPDPNHSEDICSTYEPTDFAKQVNSSVARGQQIRLAVHFEPHPTTGLRYPIISVQGFDRTPYVCRSSQTATDSGEGILKQGVVYLRRPSAETSEVSTPQDWEQLISLTIRKRREEFLSEFGQLLERMASPTSVPVSAIQNLEMFTTEMHGRAFGTKD